MGNEKKKKAKWQVIIVYLVAFSIGIAGGIYIINYRSSHESGSGGLLQPFISLTMWLAAYYIQIIVHEAGHLIFGLATGYRFGSFRVFSFMLIRSNGRFRLKRYSLAGTGGQCIMIPPDLVDGRMPVVLFNLGGCILNLALAAVSVVLFVVLYDYYIAGTLFFSLALFGLFFAASNGIPMQTSSVSNDGYNAVALLKDQKAIRALWIQMKMMELASEGVRIKDAPGECFEMPSDEEMKNCMIAPIGVFLCNRLMDEERFSEADALIEKLLSGDNAISGAHRALMVCDRIYVEAIGGCRREVIDALLTKEQRRFMVAMKSFISVIRTEYVYALLVEGDSKKAAALKADFEKCAGRYPYAIDVESESELIAEAERVGKERSAQAQSGYFSYVG